jgi:hypothetical protein
MRFIARFFLVLLSLLFATVPLKAGDRFSPRGVVSVIDNRLHEAVPICGVEIELTLTNGRKMRTYSDENGHFKFAPTEKAKSYRLVWRNEGNQFFLSDGKDSPAVLNGPSASKPWNLVIGEKGKDHFRATIFRAAHGFVSADFVDELETIRELQINAHYRRKRGGGSGKARYHAMTKELYFWGLKKRSGKPYNDVYLWGFVSHEMSHAHHDRFYEGRSQYFNTSTRLRESWAEAMKYFLVEEEYGDADSIPELSDYAKQSSTLHSGWRNHHWGKHKNYLGNYTPLMIDLVDTLNQRDIDDRVSGYTMREIQAVMKDEECRDFESLERLLKERYDNPTEKYLSTLFKEMDEK